MATEQRYQTAYHILVYTPADTILHDGHPQPVVLDTVERTAAYFASAMPVLLALPAPPYVLLNYAHLVIPAALIPAYLDALAPVRPHLLAIVRYGFSADLRRALTKGVVSAANAKASQAGNISPDEASARAAIARMQQEATRKGEP